MLKPARPYGLTTRLAAVMACILAGPATGASDQARLVLRDLPYPFHHVVSFSSDADELKPWHEAAIHRVFNEDLGLPITDSIWPHGSRRLSSLMLGPGRVNDTPTPIDGHTTFGLLLREWHRGNIDQFHGWNEDSSYQLRDEITLPLKTNLMHVALPETNRLIVSQQRQNLRLYFRGTIPRDLSLTITAESGESISYDAETVAKSHIAADGFDDAIEVFMPADSKGEADLRINAGRIRHITLNAPSCADECDAVVKRVERDDFSRKTVEAEMQLIESLNLRPTFLTSHGGTTLLQDFGMEGRAYQVPREPGTVFADPQIVVKREAKADDVSNHAYHADLLSKIGVDSVWPYFPERPTDYFAPLKTSADAPLASLTSSFDGFYNIPRSNTGEFDRSSVDAFATDLKRLLPDLSDEDRKALYCGVNCDSAQGDALAMLAATSVAMIKRGEPVRHFWYTHFGSRGSDFLHTINAPLTPVTMKWMRELANLSYNFDGKVKPEQRVWVPAASTWVRYQMMHQAIADHLTISADGARMTITPWQDPITGRMLPDVKAGTRDLNGLTLYVPNPSTARIFIGDDEITSFTRNAPDATGRASITIVDDHTPTAILDHVPLREKGQLVVENGDVLETIGTAADPVSSRILTLTADATGEAEMTFKPSRLEFWNISDLQLALRKHTPQNVSKTTSLGQLEIDLVMDDGKIVTINETETPETALLPASQWHIAPLSPNENWRHETLSTAALDFPELTSSQDKWKRPPLPIGKVRMIRIALINAPMGASVDIADFKALRADPNATAEDNSKTVMGRVTSDGKIGLANIKIRANSARDGALKTSTDDNGYFILPHRPKGDIMSIAAIVNGQACMIAQGRHIEIVKNEAELDINSSACQPVVSAAVPLDTNLIQ